jgi:hypothetical protein
VLIALTGREVLMDDLILVLLPVLLSAMIWVMISAMIAGPLLARVARAATDARTVARDPQIRVKPQDPWEVFESVYKKRTRSARRVGTGLYAVTAFVLGVFAMLPAHLVARTAFVIAGISLLAALLLTLGRRGQWFWAPWLEDAFHLTVALLLTAVGVLLLALMLDYHVFGVNAPKFFIAGISLMAALLFTLGRRSLWFWAPRLEDAFHLTVALLLTAVGVLLLALVLTYLVIVVMVTYSVGSSFLTWATARVVWALVFIFVPCLFCYAFRSPRRDQRERWLRLHDE